MHAVSDIDLDPATPQRMNAEAERAFALDGSDPNLVFALRQAYVAGWLKHKQLDREAWRPPIRLSPDACANDGAEASQNGPDVKESE